MTPQAASFHLLEANHHDGVGHTALDHRPREVEAGGASAAVVVDVVDGNAGHPKLVEDPLAAGAVAVAVAGHALIDVVVIDMCIKKGFDAGLVAEL